MASQPYTINELIESLQKGEYEIFRFTELYAVTDLENCWDEVFFDVVDGKISNELTEFAVNVLKNLDECIRKAKPWLNEFKPDKMYLDAFDKGFELYGIFFGKFEFGHQPKPATNGFTISFKPINYYPCIFTVKYHENMHPFAIEEWVF